MNIEYLKELRQFSQSMNVSKTARELHVSQPSLTRHIQQMEDELGFPLVSRQGQVKLTPAGRYFLGGISQLIGTYDTLVDQCRQIDAKGVTELVFQEPPLRSDQASARMYQIADNLREQHAYLSIHFTRPVRSNIAEMFEKRAINLALVYGYGPVEKTIEQYQKQGYLIKHLATEQAVVWCNSANPLVQKNPICIEDIKRYPIMLPSTSYDPLKEAWTNMCHSHGFDMKTYDYQTSVYSDYLFADVTDEIFLLLSSMTEQTRLKSRLQRTFVFFKEGEALIESFIVMPKPTCEAEFLLASVFDD